MLKQAELTEALHTALQTATPPCGTFCRSSAELDDDRYALAHNGTGDRDTWVLIVHLPAVLNLSKDGLTASAST